LGVAHDCVYFAGRNGHDDALNRADLFVCDVLFPGHAKVMIDSWLALSGHGCRESDHCRCALIQVVAVTDRIIKSTVNFVLFVVQHCHSALHDLKMQL
jgi:hypothetical protein